MPARPSVHTRRRQKRRDARQRILDAAHALLEEAPWSEVRLEDVMARADLTRTTFYRHFDDREQVLLALLETLGIELELTADPWELTTDDPCEGKQLALARLTDTFVRHGRVLRAIADAAGYDPEIRAHYQGLADRLVAGAEARLREDVAAGLARLDDPHEVARALIWLNERYLLETFGRRPFAAEPEAAAGALYEVWTRTIYGER